MSLKKDEVLMRWHTWWGDRIGLVLRRSEKILRSLNHNFRRRYKMYTRPGVEGKEEEFK